MQAVAAADGDAVDALFSEAFALLEGAAPTSPSPSQQPAPARKRTHGEGSASRRKRWLDELRDEETALRGELARLRGRVAHPEARERALAERVKRRRAEQECEQLREVLYQQTQFLRGLRGFLSVGSPCSLSLNLYHHLHSFTRLPRDASARQIEYAALRRDQRFRAAIELLQRETAALPVAGVQSQTDFAHAPDEPCAITTKRVYVMDDCDVPMVLRAACVAVHDIVAHCRSYKWVGVAGESVDAEALAASGGQYCVTSIRRTSELDTEGFSVESRSLTMHKTTDGSAVMLWDFVDEDELHPLDESPDIFRQGVGACLVRREVCSDGVERTVYREVSTRRYEYRGPMPPSPSVVRYFASKRDVTHDYERLFHDLMVEQIARDKAMATATASQRPLLECSV